MAMKICLSYANISFTCRAKNIYEVSHGCFVKMISHVGRVKKCLVKKSLVNHPTEKMLTIVD